MTTLRQNRRFRAGFLALALAASAWLPTHTSAQSYAQFNVPLPMMQRSVVSPDTEGRMGRVALDPVTRRYYIAAFRHGTLQVLDPSGMKVIQVVRDLNEPQGVVVIPAQKRIAVSCGDGSVKIFAMGDDANATLTLEHTIKLGGEADAMRFEESAKRLWVGHGKNLTPVNPATGDKEPSIAMPGMVKGLAVEQKPDGRVFVNIPSRGEVVVVDKAKSAIVHTWALKDLKNNAPMALDEAGNRLFVATRGPGKLLALSTKDGAELNRFDVQEDADEVWWDVLGKRVYVSAGGGAGQIAMFRQTGDKLAVEHMVNTLPGARTCTLSQERRRLVVLAPKLGDTPAFVFVYIVPGENESVPPGTKQP